VQRVGLVRAASSPVDTAGVRSRVLSLPSPFSKHPASASAAPYRHNGHLPRVLTEGKRPCTGCRNVPCPAHPQRTRQGTRQAAERAETAGDGLEGLRRHGEVASGARRLRGVYRPASGRTETVVSGGAGLRFAGTS